MLYKNLSSYLKERYGKKIKKLCIDGGFSCPNRDGRCGVGGCVFCGERGAGEHIDPTLSIGEQVREGLSHGTAEGYIAYFQNFTNTYATPEVLRERYDAALIDERIVALAIGTRPDCIDEEIAALIAEYKSRLDVWVELGLQTSSDKTAKRINRGYDSAVFERAMEILTRHGIPVVVHLIIGLPGEGDAELAATVDLINRYPLFGVKIHSLYVSEGTRLAEEYRRGDFSPITLEEYVERAAYALTHIRPELVVHRITGDCPRGMLVAPEWNSDKNAVIAAINQRLASHGERQGCYYRK